MIDFTTEDLSHPVIIVGLVIVCCLLWRGISYLFSRITHSKDKVNDAIVEQLRELNDKFTELLTDVRIMRVKSLNIEDDIKVTNESVKKISCTVAEHSKMLAVHSEKIKNLERK
jgi:hypothetical protein